MPIGSYIIANDLLGVLTAKTGNMVVVCDKEGKEHKIVASSCQVIANPHALALLLYNKILAEEKTV